MTHEPPENTDDLLPLKCLPGPLETLVREAETGQAVLWAVRQAWAAATDCPPATPAEGEDTLRTKARDLGRRLHAAADRLRLLGGHVERLTDVAGPFPPVFAPAISSK